MLNHNWMEINVYCIDYLFYEARDHRFCLISCYKVVFYYSLLWISITSEWERLTLFCVYVFWTLIACVCMTAKVAANGDCNKAENPNKCKCYHYPQCHHTHHSQSDHMRAAERFQDVRVGLTVHRTCLD